MKIGILYICTGRYRVFWEAFYDSCEKYFLPDVEKTYFVFTDSSAVQSSAKIKVFFRKSKGFPLDSLLRFDYFSEIKNECSCCDYIYFFNSNMKFVSEVGSEVLPSIGQSGLVALLHPGRYNKLRYWHPYERRKKSSASMSMWEGNGKYYMGALNGGMTEAYFELVEACKSQIHQDLDKNIIAIYHDESHLNRYLVRRNILELSPQFGCPEGWDLPFEPKILILDKIKHGGGYFDKLPRHAYGTRLLRILARAFHTLGSLFRWPPR